LKVENALGRRGAPVPHRIEEDPDAAAASLVSREAALERLRDRVPIETDLLHDRRGNVDLRVGDAAAPQVAHEIAREARVVRRGSQHPADVAVEREEPPGRAEIPAATLHAGKIRENGSRGAA